MPALSNQLEENLIGMPYSDYKLLMLQFATVFKYSFSKKKKKKEMLYFIADIQT